MAGEGEFDSQIYIGFVLKILGRQPPGFARRDG